MILSRLFIAEFSELIKRQLHDKALCLLPLFFYLICDGCMMSNTPFYNPRRSEPSPKLYSLSNSRAVFRELSVALEEDQLIAMILPRRGESWLAFGKRVLADKRALREVQKNHPRRALSPQHSVRVPFRFLNAEWKKRVIEMAFPEDRQHTDDWRHVVASDGESMRSIAEAFTGNGNNGGALLVADNRSAGDEIERGNIALIAHNLVSNSLASPQRVLATADLTIEKDSRGREHAVYALKAGEALYSAVVVRFCGVVDADEVNAVAEKLMAYNGIRDPSRIPAGAKIKIPIEYLDEEILRGEAPAKRTVAVRRYNGLHVILDAGHGGNDPGTTVRGWSEDEIAYDIMVRLKRILQRKGVQVHALVADGDTGDEPQNHVIRHNRNEYVKVSPPYKMQDSRVALNMRVYLVDDIYRRLRRRGVRDEDIMLISIHLDHLHPAVDGVMVYYPDAAERPESYSASGRIYASHDESRVLSIRYDGRENQQVESYSYDFATNLIASCRNLRVPVHDYQPIRRFVYRRGRKWTPGIIHYSRVRTSVLVEAANLANRSDFKRIRSSDFRQRIAEAMARAIR